MYNLPTMDFKNTTVRKSSPPRTEMYKKLSTLDVASEVSRRKSSYQHEDDSLFMRRTTTWEQSVRGLYFSRGNSTQYSTRPSLYQSFDVHPTGSSYSGEFDELGMHGYGFYTFPNGVEYEGMMSDGRFQGKGKLKYPDGTLVDGTWKKGKLHSYSVEFKNDVETFEEPKKNCELPDRRFSVEKRKGMKPAGCSILTDAQPTRKIPPGLYDTVDGFYDPKTKIVMAADNLNKIIRVPDDPKEIEASCRKAWDEPVGPRPDLYEEWMKCKTIDESDRTEDADETKSLLL